MPLLQTLCPLVSLAALLAGDAVTAQDKPPRPVPAMAKEPRVDGSLADTISLFRVARPATYIATAAVATLTLEFLPLQWSFLVLALVMLWGLRYALTLKDTR